MVRHIRRILKLSFASLWLVDRSHHLLVKEAVDVDPGTKLGKLETENDERVTKWQMENKESLLVAKPTNDSCPISLLSPFPFSFITLPVISKGELLGNLNLYSSHSFKWPLQHDRIFENMDFLRSISTQIAMFHENRSLHKHATFNKEIHHRVKNNLQNIASLLRLQLRRLDHLSPEQALTDSISRIMSMALVHETLSQNEIGMVDLGPLLGSISKVPDFPDRQMITLDVSGPPVLLPSREATSLALVVNELVQNALHHGLGRRRDGKISLRIERTDSLISVVVQDDGPGLTENFDPGRHANLGLTIVRTLVKEDLKGEFSIGSEDGTKATVTFPLPEGCYQID
jgi:two-component sensor histidine kinase